MNINFSLSLDSLVQKIKEIRADKPFVIGVTGLSGSGKTTLAKYLLNIFQEFSVHVSEDYFCVISTSVRKSFLCNALENQDFNRLRYLAKPIEISDNPYANPISWYDWQSLILCLNTLKEGGSYKMDTAWNQKTGELDTKIFISTKGIINPIIIVDTNYPLQYRNKIDLLVYLDIDPNLASSRQKSRDSHRSDNVYFAYKKMVENIYCIPYARRSKISSDIIIKVS